MEQPHGECAFISGGASGIGFAVAKALASEGVKIAIGDIDRAALTRATDDLKALGATVCSTTLDVADAASWAAAETATEAGI